MTAGPKAILLAAALLSAPIAAHAGKATVCTITVNSPDEREVLRQSLPPDQYEFVELVERGRPDWLASACQQHVSCDVLVVSGHFAGTEFYSSRFDTSETLPVDEMERVACSNSCPDLFSHLKEVYLFGCDTLNPAPAHTASSEIARSLVRSGHSPEEAERAARELGERYAESSREHMRRIFPNVPLIYGFSSLAPLGRVAGPMLRRYFEVGADEPFGSGRSSARLLKLFGPSSMVATEGLREGEPNADVRAEACRFYDDRQRAADKVETIHDMMAGEIAVARLSLERIEKFFATLSAADRDSPAFTAALSRLAGDMATRERYLAFVRDADDPAVRVRMIALARTVGWLSPAEQRAELGRAIHDVLASGSMGFGEVDLVCTLNKDGSLDAAVERTGFPAIRTAQSAGLACLGSRDARSRVLKALASADESDVQVAQAYLRHHPIEDAAELRSVALAVSQMSGVPAQVRALEALARLHVSDREVLRELARLFERTRSPEVQRAIAEVFLRADPREAASPELLTVLEKRRLPSRGGPDLVDVLLSRLHAS